MRSVLPAGLAVLLTFGLQAKADGPPSVRVKAGDLEAARKSDAGYINPELVGFNVLYWIDNQEKFDSGRLVEDINGIKPGLLRYPAGTASQNYDWRSNEVINPNVFPFATKGASLDTDRFISVVEQTGAGAVVVVDITSAHLKERKKGINVGQEGYLPAQPVSEAEEEAMVEKAAAWAAHLKSKGLSPVFYELGNEHYLAFLDYMVFTPEGYAAKCKRIIRAIREKDPAAKFGLCGPSRFHRGHYLYEDKIWWPTVLRELAGDVERLALHEYWQPKAAEAGEDPGARYGAFQGQLKEWGEKEGIPTGHLKVGLTEWGGRGHMDEETFGLFTFRVLSGFAKHGVDFAIQWPFRWQDDPKDEFGQVQLVVKGSGRKTFAYHVMAAWRRFFSGKRLVEIAADGLPPRVWPVCAVGADGSPVVAIANGGDRPLKLRLDVAWPSATRPVSLHTLGPEGLAEPLQFDPKSKEVTVAPRTIAIVGDGAQEAARP